jgi:hypothetical protein
MKISEIIQEVEEIDITKSKRNYSVDRPKTIKQLDDAGAMQILRVGDILIYRDGSKSVPRYTSVLQSTGRVQIILECEERNGVLTNLRLMALPGNTLSAAKFYHMLITKLNKTLVGTHQSPGSQATWAKLNKYRDVEIHGWLNGKPVNITPLDREYAYAPAVGYFSPQELKDANKMKLVACKK